MTKTRGGVFTALFFVSTFLVNTVVFAKEKILYKDGAYIFTQSNANDLVELGEFLGRSKFSAKHKKALLAWSIEDFKPVPKKGFFYYKDLRNNLLPKIRKMKVSQSKLNGYRTELYLNYVDLFNKYPEYKASPDNFVAMINRYNPPVPEAVQLQQLRFNVFQSQMNMNQMMFNQTMRTQQNAADNVSKSIRDQATRYSITIPGGTVLYETKDRLYAKDRDGKKFDIAR